MAKGIIYVMTTSVSGLIKIGKSSCENFHQDVDELEHGGYQNVSGLELKYAMEVEDVEDIKKLLFDVFSKSNLPETELFVLNLELLIHLMSNLQGEKVYPVYSDKKGREVFMDTPAENDRETQTEIDGGAKRRIEEGIRERALKDSDCRYIPDGIYYLSVNQQKFGRVDAQMEVEGDVCRVLKGSVCSDCVTDEQARILQQSVHIENHVLMEDVVLTAPSSAARLVLGQSANGWITWKNSAGESIDVYRPQRKSKVYR